MSSRRSARVLPRAGKERSAEAPAAKEAQPFWSKAPLANEAGAPTIRGASAPTANRLSPWQARFAPRPREPSPFGDAPADGADLPARILNTLYWDLAVPSDHLSVTLERDLVTISGAVAYSYQKSSAEADVRRVPGVRGVTNAIEIKLTGSQAARVPPH